MIQITKGQTKTRPVRPGKSITTIRRMRLMRKSGGDQHYCDTAFGWPPPNLRIS